MTYLNLMPMKQNSITFILAISLALSSPLAMAADKASPGGAQQPMKKGYYCPPIDKLHKTSKKVWIAPGGWRSFTTSFVETVAHFYGAQWSGAKIGQLTCIYKGKDASSFPILLVFHKLTFAPLGGKWQAEDTKINCYSRDRRECAFQVPTPPKQEDIFKALEHAKDNPLLYKPI